MVLAGACFQVFCRKFGRLVVAGDFRIPNFPMLLREKDVFSEDSLDLGLTNSPHRWFHKGP